MKTDEIENIEAIRRLTNSCLRTLKPAGDKNGLYTAEIRVSNYFELAAIIRNLMKLCMVALDQDSAEIPRTIESQTIDVRLILGVALQLFPIDEFELLNEMNALFPEDHDLMRNKETN
ncbi:hypothetical protein [Flavobacterium salmonis]|uniref:Uncharacterized protein n=1 Tax=Flavobacterium salmonis TaxID=2654844 RepID=A0A6V6Z4K6_9FLAO|nr:hypothetical protein [Flavobacterium salmonis]CAD0006727.1 hypothetical protein FLAT13_03456 [Flavobacterium salmonis]